LGFVGLRVELPHLLPGGKYDALGDVRRPIADPLQIVSDEQQVEACAVCPGVSIIEARSSRKSRV
jgi:hypothetical protein